MKRTAMLILLLAGLMVHQSFAAPEAPVKCTAEQVAECVAAAPALPENHPDLDLGLKLRLVDYIDFTNPDDPHDMIDRGTSRIVEGPAGKYRVTAEHRHAQFAVRWKADGTDKPHLLVWEYPDDAKREICFFTHESPLAGRKNIDWSLETGVYTGDPLPTSGTMRYHTFFFWPVDNWPVAMVMNWARFGAPGAASRLWVFAVEGEELPAFEINDPDPENPRLFGTVYNWSLVPTRGIYGLKDSQTALEHIVEYHRYRGDNIIAWPVVANNSWGFRCQIPAWDGGDGKQSHNAELDKILEVCERKGMKFLAIINANSHLAIGGKSYEQDQAAYIEGYRTGLTQFIERYGKSKALHGINFDTQDLSAPLGRTGLDNARNCLDGLDGVVKFIKDRAPQLKVYHFLGGRVIHDQYFSDAGDIIGRWEAGSSDWPTYLAGEAERLWTSWDRNPATLNAVEGLTTVLGYQHDDHAIFDEYYQNPRAMFYYDLEASAPKANLIDTRAALIWNTFFEGYIGLSPANWWYLKVWVAPDFKPASTHALAGWARAQGHRDRDMILCGSWNRTGGGQEAALRRWARAFRSLPPVEMADAAIGGTSPVLARTALWQGRNYAALLNPTPWAQNIAATLNGTTRNLEIAPFALEVMQADGAGVFSASGDINPAYVAWVTERLDNYEKLLNEVRQLNAEAAPAQFAAHLAGARQSSAVGKWLAADLALGHGLTDELALRRRILAPPVQTVPRLAAAPALDGNLDAWPAAAADLQSTDANIGTHLFFTTQWEGLDDLSARVRLGHDGTTLYIGIAVRDDTLSPKDGLTLCLSPELYRQWLPQSLKYEHRLNIGLPRDRDLVEGRGAFGFQYKNRRVDGGYIVEGTLPLAELGLEPGSRIGWVLQISDDDNTTYLANDSWARKSILLMPNDTNFAYWDDPRTCGEWVIE